MPASSTVSRDHVEVEPGPESLDGGQEIIRFASVLVLLVLPSLAEAQTVDRAKVDSLNSIVSAYMSRQGIPGLSAAIAAAVGAGQLETEQVGDQLGLEARVPLDRRQSARRSRRVELSLLQDHRPGEDGVQRRAQFVLCT